MLFCTFKGCLSVLAMYIFGLNYKLSIYCTQGKGNVILTKNSKGKFPHNPLPLPFLPTPLQLHKKKQDKPPPSFQRFRDFLLN